jgi:exopolysaccharide biosynthesis WecB/TagA/CpsF family protein
MVGSTAISLQRAADVLATRHPGVSIVAQIAPPMGFNPIGPSADEVITKLQESGAQICFLALGASKQEIFAANAQRVLPHMGFISIGAGIDFLSGKQKRAPYFIRQIKLEWLWRLIADPKRLLSRYISCFRILPTAIYCAFRARRDIVN